MTVFRRTAVLLCAAVVSPITPGPWGIPQALAQPAPFDVVISGGTVVDPETNLQAVRNVGIRGGRIAAVSTAALRGRTTVNAKGLIVAPGFIDIHVHGQAIVTDWL